MDKKLSDLSSEEIAKFSSGFTKMLIDTIELLKVLTRWSQDLQNDINMGEFDWALVDKESGGIFSAIDRKVRKFFNGSTMEDLRELMIDIIIDGVDWSERKWTR